MLNDAAMLTLCVWIVVGNAATPGQDHQAGTRVTLSFVMQRPASFDTQSELHYLHCSLFIGREQRGLSV